MGPRRHRGIYAAQSHRHRSGLIGRFGDGLRAFGETLMAKSAFSAVDQEPLSHNLLGQRLGKKGRDTRERILAATERLLAGPPDAPITLSAVAREASLGMTSLYLYFNDLTELLLAQLSTVVAQTEEAYAGHLRGHWPDES